MYYLRDKVDKKLGNDRFRGICANADTSKVTILNAGLNSLTKQGIYFFCQAKWNHLQSLFLQKNRIGGKGCKYLSLVKMENLQKLHLDNAETGDNGVLHLVKAQWIKLKDVHLWGNHLGNGSISRLVRAKWDLGVLSLGNNKLTGEQMMKIMLIESPSGSIQILLALEKVSKTIDMIGMGEIQIGLGSNQIDKTRGLGIRDKLKERFVKVITDI